MTEDQPRFHKLLQGYADEILHWQWDPIGIAGEPYARDEYDGYVPSVVRLLLEDRSQEEIAEHLCGLETGPMGLVRNTPRALETAETLLAYRDWLREKLSDL